MAMKSYMVFFLLLFLTVLLHCGTVFGAYQREYLIEVHVDGSATWTIEHRFLLETEQDEILFRQYSNLPYFSDFQRSIREVLDLARNVTGREDMSVENFQMVIDVFDSYKIVRYKFDWIKFAERKGAEIKMEDIFQVDGLFLLGDGSLSIICPSGYIVKTVHPKPNIFAGQMLTWYAVTDVKMAELTVVFEEETGNVVTALMKNASLIIGLITFFGGVSASLWFFFKFRKKKKEVTYGPVIIPRIEGEEEKVIAFLREAGGYMYQSTLADRFGVSRSKISKLLRAMEEKGSIRRYKKGREKVVMLPGIKIEDNEGDGWGDS